MVLVLVVHLAGRALEEIPSRSTTWCWVAGARRLPESAACRAFRHLPWLPLWLALPTRPVLPALGEVGTSTCGCGCVALWVLVLPMPDLSCVAVRCERGRCACRPWVGWPVPVCCARQHVGTVTGGSLPTWPCLPLGGRGTGRQHGGRVGGTAARVHLPVPAVAVQAGQCRGGGIALPASTSGARVVGGEHPLALPLLGGLRHLLGVHEAEAAVLLCGCG